MQLVMWVIVGILTGAAAIVLIPILVVGTWYVVMTVILGLVDGIVWLLDQQWKRRTCPQVNTRMPPNTVDVANGKVVSTG